MQFLKYSLVRLAVFFVVFLALVYGLGWDVWVSGLIGLIIAFCVSYLFLRKLRLAADADLRRMLAGQKKKARTPARESDEDVEDRLQDGQQDR